jgi:hypothetical protein
MQNLKKKIFILFLFVYLLIGSFNSINTGISFDEYHEELNWKFHVNTFINIKNVITNKERFKKKEFNEEVKRFVGYGIGSQIISQPIQFFLKDIIKKNKNLDEYGAKLLSKHFVIFIFFFTSGIFFYLILRKIIDSENFAFVGTCIYLLYPYLFGQAMFSPKDIPFMSIWLICTYVSFNLFDNLIKNNEIKYNQLLLFSIITSYLLSIRFAGILIFIQYTILFFLFINLYKINFINFFRIFYQKFLFYLFFLILFIFIFNPIFLIDPFLLIKTIKINASHFNNVGTNTWGKIMYAKDLPSTYLPIWFAVKIPFFIWLGILVLPFTEKKIFFEKKKSIFFGNILLIVLAIPLILIFMKVHLYDEIRQVMFLIPLIFIVGLISFYVLSIHLFYILGVLTICFFLVENIKTNPFQYVWFNLPSRFIDLTTNFELEYQGISGREISKFLIKIDDQNICILSNPIHTVKPFLKNTKYDCFDIWQKIDSDYKRPFLAVQHVRNIKKGLPYNCRSIYESNFKLLFHKKKFVTGKLLKCD